jgi:hypothetical protein
MIHLPALGRFDRGETGRDVPGRATDEGLPTPEYCVEAEGIGPDAVTLVHPAAITAEPLPSRHSSGGTGTSDGARFGARGLGEGMTPLHAKMIVRKSTFD